jgi:hypothetical protein
MTSPSTAARPLSLTEDEPHTRTQGEILSPEFCCELCVMREDRPDASAPKREGIPLDKLKPRQCRFIVDEHALPVRFCGEPTVRGGSWCEEHRQLVYVSSSPRSRTAGQS